MSTKDSSVILLEAGKILAGDNYRTTEAAEGLEELGASIQQMGLLVPLLVRAEGEKYFLLDGYRRLMAIKALKDGRPIPVKVLQFDEAASLEAAIAANLQRKDVHPFDEAQAIEKLQGRFKRSREWIAAHLGKPPRFVGRRLKLLSLIPEAQKVFREGKLQLAHAELLAPLQEKEQKKMLGYVKHQDYDVTAADLFEEISRDVYLRLDEAPFDTKDAKLVPAAGPCSTCLKRTGSSPGLFPDQVEAETCTDRACHKQKVEAHLQAAIEATKKLSPRFARLSSEGRWYVGGKKGELSRDDYVVTKSLTECEHARHGVIVHVDRHHVKELGLQLFICSERSCKVHRPGSSQSVKRSQSPEDRLKKMKSRADAASRGAFVQSLYGQCSSPVPKPKQRKADELIVGYLFARLGHDYQNAFGKALELPATKAQWGGKYYARAVGQLAAEKKKDPRKLALLMIAASDMAVGSYYGPAEDMLRVGRLVGLDLDKLRATALKAEREKLKQKKAAAKKRAKLEAAKQKRAAVKKGPAKKKGAKRRKPSAKRQRP